LLEQLRSQLHAIGKTQLAIEYAWRYAKAGQSRKAATFRL
jgi:hypothetical protein